MSRRIGILALALTLLAAPATAQHSGSAIGSHVAVGQQGLTPTNGAPVTSAANTAQSITLVPSVAGTRICLRGLYLFSSAAGTPTLTVQDGAVVFLNFGTLATTTAAQNVPPGGLPASGFCAATGNNIVINVGAAGVGVTTTTSFIADAN